MSTFSKSYGLMMMGFFAGFLSGCAAFRHMEMPPLPQNIPPVYELEAVPFFPQKEYQCGPAALAMVLGFSGLRVQPDDLVDQVYTPSRRGSLQMAIIGAIRRQGRLAYQLSDLESVFPEIAAGHPVIILQNLGLAWYPVWHYAVIIGYNDTEQHVVLRSGADRRKVMPFGVFEKTWARADYWGLLVLQPHQLPATATEEAFLASVVGLEKAQRFEAAIAGYQTALARWPRNLTAYMGLGNSYYAIGDLGNAERALREGIRLHPDSGCAYNNLAQVLVEQGRKQEALEAARKAVAIGGTLGSVYQQTLEEIQSAPAE